MAVRASICYVAIRCATIKFFAEGWQHAHGLLSQNPPLVGSIRVLPAPSCQCVSVSVFCFVGLFSLSACSVASTL